MSHLLIFKMEKGSCGWHCCPAHYEIMIVSIFALQITVRISLSLIGSVNICYFFQS